MHWINSYLRCKNLVTFFCFRINSTNFLWVYTNKAPAKPHTTLKKEPIHQKKIYNTLAILLSYLCAECYVQQNIYWVKSKYYIFNPYNAQIILYRSWRPKGLFQFEIIKNFLIFFCFIWIPMLWIYDHHKYFDSFSEGTIFIRQNLTSNFDVTVHALNMLINSLLWEWRQQMTMLKDKDTLIKIIKLRIFEEVNW